jgi:hypothetical protein
MILMMLSNIARTNALSILKWLDSSDLSNTMQINVGYCDFNYVYSALESYY